MDGQAITTKSDLERILLDESMEAKPLSLSLLKCITNNFSDEHKIGYGGFAVVYKVQTLSLPSVLVTAPQQNQVNADKGTLLLQGRLEYGEVAVKKLSQNCIHEEKFIGEVDCMMKAKHKNIVRFLGYCSDTQGERVEHNGKFVMADVRQRLLCFEYVPNGSLDKYINGTII
jgi:serine/threonine protein kinase